LRFWSWLSFFLPTIVTPIAETSARSLPSR
jgi:hypothetical protein